MPEAITADFYVSRGVPADQAAAMAAEHNSLAGIRTETAPPVSAPPVRLPPPTPRPTPVAQPNDAERADAEIADIDRRRMSGEISDYDWRKTWERKKLELAGVAGAVDAYNAGTSADRNVARQQWADDEIQSAFERSLDAGMQPAKSPADYAIPGPDRMSPEEADADRTFREALFAAGASRELGNRLGESVTITAQELLAAHDNLDAEVAIVERNERDLRQRWGASYERNLEAVRGLLREAGERSPPLREMIEGQPEIFSSVDSMNYLLRLAEHRQRRGAR